MSVGGFGLNGIVTNGLVLNLDAANRRSFVSGSTSWNDLSGNGNTGTLTNGPTFNSSNGGSIVFDGTNQYIDLGDKDIFTNPSGFTFDTFFNPSSLTNNPIFEKYQAGGFEYVGGFLNSRLYFLVYDNTAGRYIGRFTNILTSIVTTNQWCYLSFVYTGGTLSDSIKLYINTIQSDVSSDTNGAITTIRNTNTSLTLARSNSGLGGPIRGRIGNIRMYNRALSATEILQNYNTLKNRYQ